MSQKIRIAVFALLCGLLIVNGINLGLAAMTDTVVTDFEYDVVPDEVLVWETQMEADGTYSGFNDETYEIMTEDFHESDLSYSYGNISSIEVIDDTHANITVDTYHNKTVDPSPSTITDWEYSGTQNIIVNNTKSGLLANGFMLLPNDVFIDDIADDDLNLLLFAMFGDILLIDPNEFADAVSDMGGIVYNDEISKSYDAIPYRMLYVYNFDGDAVIPEDSIELGVNMTIDLDVDIKMNAKHILSEIDVVMGLFMKIFMIDNATYFEQQEGVFQMSMDLIYDSIETDPTPEEVDYDFEEPAEISVWVWVIVGVVGAGAITVGVIYAVGNRTACKEGTTSKMCFKKYLTSQE